MKIRGVDLAVRETGRGRPFVFGHGLLGSMAQEDDADLLDRAPLEAGLRLVRYDARGHGGSEATLAPDDYRWPELARDMLALVDGLGCDAAALGGVSMGCATSLHAAVRAPERVTALVLMAPPTAWDTRPRQALVYRLLATAIEWFGLRLFLLLASLPRPAPRNPALARLERSVTDHLRRADARAVVCALRGAAASDLPAAEKLARLDVPALILAWQDDPTHPVSTARRLAELLPRAELHVATSAEEIRDWGKRMAEFLTAGDRR
jgi:pimeloyl-ACP methyl ester carboxylesterase